MEVQAPVFYPTMEEFQDFAKYISSIQSEVKVGICKVVPPAEWKAQFDYSHSGDTAIPSPIKLSSSFTPLLVDNFSDNMLRETEESIN